MSVFGGVEGAERGGIACLWSTWRAGFEAPPVDGLDAYDWEDYLVGEALLPSVTQKRL